MKSLLERGHHRIMYSKSLVLSVFIITWEVSCAPGKLSNEHRVSRERRDGQNDHVVNVHIRARIHYNDEEHSFSHEFRHEREFTDESSTQKIPLSAQIVKKLQPQSDYITPISDSQHTTPINDKPLPPKIRELVLNPVKEKPKSPIGVVGRFIDDYIAFTDGWRRGEFTTPFSDDFDAFRDDWRRGEFTTPFTDDLNAFKDGWRREVFNTPFTERHFDGFGMYY